MLTLAEENEKLKAEVAYWRGIAEAAAGEDLAADELQGARPGVRQVFSILLKAHGRVVRTDAIRDLLYGGRPACDFPDGNTVGVFVHYLRKRLKTYRVQTHWGVGYSLHKIDGGAP